MTATILTFDRSRIRPVENHEAKILTMPVKKGFDLFYPPIWWWDLFFVSPKY